MDPSSCAPSTSGQQTVTGTIQDIGRFLFSLFFIPCLPCCNQLTSKPAPPPHPSCFQGSLIQEVQDLLGPAEDPAPSQWKDRTASTLEKWTVLRPFMVNQMLSSEKPKEGTCHHCRSKVAVVTCHDCLPRPLHCTACDLAIHDSMVLHNRSSMVEGFYRPLPPTTHIREEEVLSVFKII